MSASQSSPDSLRGFFTQISKIRRLSQAEIVHYARQVQQMRYLLKLKAELGERLKHEPSLAEWSQVVELSESALNTALRVGQQAKRKLMEAHLYLAVAIARQYQDQGIELLDLIQEGSVGLNQGVEKYDPDKGYKISTYVCWWIRREVIRAVALKQSKDSRILLGKFNEMLERIESKQPLPEEAVALGERRDFVNQMLSLLPPRERDVLILLYGLMDNKPRSLTNAGKELGLSRDQVHRSHSKALKILRQESAQALSLII